MVENYVPNLGQKPDADARRDAIHVAVAPVVAAERMSPGMRVGICADGKASFCVTKFAGIVDPFLDPQTVIEAGEPFWLFLFPGTITGLRHVWSHPAFAPKAPE